MKKWMMVVASLLLFTGCAAEEEKTFSLTAAEQESYVEIVGNDQQSIVLGADVTKNVITFYYKLSTLPVTIAKQVTGNMGDRSKSFSFTVVAKDASGNAWRIGAAPEGANPTYIVKSDGSISFELTHGQSVTVPNAPIGGTLTITETNADGYTTTYKVGETSLEGGSYTVTDATNQTVTVTNRKEASPDTGILLDSLPYILILALVIGIGVVAFLRKRRDRDD